MTLHPSEGRAGAAQGALIQQRKSKGLQTTERFGALQNALKRLSFLGAKMPLLSDEVVTLRASYRVKTAGTKLNRDELAALAKHCADRGTTPGELIRRLILTELQPHTVEPTASAELSEIVGVRLMLTNLLKPLTTGVKITPEVFDGIMVEVKKRKTALALETKQDLERA